MVNLVDIRGFPTGRDLDYESEEEVRELDALRAEALEFLDGYRWSPPVAELVLAFGIGTVLTLFLVHFEPGGPPEDRERWLVVGNLPTMHFETDDAPTPAIALRLYCAIAQDWADNVLAGRDLSESYPIPFPPTRELAENLLGRIDFIRKELIPIA